jgi:hypothetical protein
MYTNKEIYLALKLIQDICSKNVACHKCPFCKERCMIKCISGTPEDWRLVPPPEPIEWRPFE